MASRPNIRGVERTSRNRAKVSDRSLDDRPAAEPPRSLRASCRRLWPLLVLALALALVFALDLHRFLTPDALTRHRAWLQGMVDAFPGLAIVTFVAIYVVCVAVSVPGASLLTITGGFLFGTALGSVLAVGGATAGAVLVFLAARHAIGGAVFGRIGPWASRLEAGFRANAFSYLLSLRLIPVMPFWAVNLAAAALGVPFATYAGATAIGIVPATIVYAGIGAGLGTTIDRGGSLNLGLVFEPHVLLPLLGLAALSLAPVLWRAIKSRHAR